MKIIFLYRSILAFVFALFTPCMTIAGEAPSDDIKKAGREGIAVFLKDTRIGSLNRLGFESQADIDNAELGDGFQIFTINPDKLLDESSVQELQSLVTPTNQWVFVIRAGMKANALLRVEVVDGKWIPVSIGASELARELSSLMAKWPVSSGYEYRFIRVYQARSDLIELSRGGKFIGFIPLTTLIMAPGRLTGIFDLSDLREQKDILPGLRSTVKQNTR